MTKITPPGRLKSIVKRLPIIPDFILFIKSKIREIKDSDIFCKHAAVINRGYGSYKKLIRGTNNEIHIGENTRMTDTVFHIIGNNNVIRIGKNCSIGKGCSFWMEGNDIQITIGDNTTFTQFCHFNAQENGSVINVAEDCMFSNHIIVRTSDSHPIYDIETNQRINSAKPIYIGRHVWIAPDTKIMKGADICEGCIIGSNTMVSKHIPANSLAVGQPAKVVKQNLRWSREDIIFRKQCQNNH